MPILSERRQNWQSHSELFNLQILNQFTKYISPSTVESRWCNVFVQITDGECGFFKLPLKPSSVLVVNITHTNNISNAQKAINLFFSVSQKHKTKAIQTRYIRLAVHLAFVSTVSISPTMRSGAACTVNPRMLASTFIILFFFFLFALLFVPSSFEGLDWRNSRGVIAGAGPQILSWWMKNEQLVLKP